MDQEKQAVEISHITDFKSVIGTSSGSNLQNVVVKVNKKLILLFYCIISICLILICIFIGIEVFSNDNNNNNGSSNTDLTQSLTSGGTNSTDNGTSCVNDVTQTSQI